MTLLEQQFRFSRMVADLIKFAYDSGYTLSLGDAFRDSRCAYGHQNSLHKVRLAIDLNLFKDGKYLRGESGYDQLGEYWESIGGSYGVGSKTITILVSPGKECGSFESWFNGIDRYEDDGKERGTNTDADSQA